LAAVELATAYISLVPSLKGASQKISDELNPAAASSGAKAGDRMGSSIIGAAAKWAAPIAAAVGFGAVLKSGFDEAKDAAAGTAQLAAGIASTGNAASLSVDGLNSLASEIQNYSGQTDDSIVKSEQLLQTFTNIKNTGPDKIFDQATKASADMAAKFGGDASSQAVLLGKALNDPVKGITALTRVGVSITDEQKKTIDAMVKTGDVAGAQKVILKELGTEFGGAAKAAGQSFPGQLDRVHRAFEDLSQGVVQGFLPVMGPALEGVIGILQKVGPVAADAAQKVADKAAVVGGAVKGVFELFKTGNFTGGIGKALGVEEDSKVVGVILSIRDGVTTAFGAIKSALSGIDFGKIFGSLASTIGPLIPQFVSLWNSLSPIQTIFQAIQPFLPQILNAFVQLASVVGGALGSALTTLVPVFVQLQGVFVSVFQQVLATVLPVIVQLVTMLGSTFTQLVPVLVPIIVQIVTLAATLITQLAPIFMQLVSTVLPMVVTILGAVLGAVLPLITMLAGLLIPIIKMLMPVVVVVFGAIANIITAVMQIIMGIIQVVTGIITGNWGQVWEGIKNIFSGIWNAIVAVVTGVFAIIGTVIMSGLNAVASFIGGVLGNIGQFFADTWNNVVNGVSGMIGQVGGFFSGLWDTITGALSGAGKWLFDAGQNIVNGLFDGIKSLAGTIGNFFLGLLPGWIVEPFKLALGIQSPSRVFRQLGNHIGEGLMMGTGDKKDDIGASMRDLVTVPDVPVFGASVSGAKVSGRGGHGSVIQNIHPAPGMSEETIGRIAAHSLNYQIRMAR